jgi:hypothetical protein
VKQYKCPHCGDLLVPRLCTQILIETENNMYRKITYMEEMWVCYDCNFTESVFDCFANYDKARKEAAKILKTLPWETKP